LIARRDAPRPVSSVLFVCTGNICRSPIVENVFRALLEREGLDDRILVDSAGTNDYQVGQAPDPRATFTARRRGYEVAPRRARLVSAGDFDRFEWILAMDRRNLAALEAIRPPTFTGHLGLFLDLAPKIDTREVPDPYYGGVQGFERVLDLAEQASAALLAAVEARIAARARATGA
jgi:protein-tyrosine phosphatase